MRSLASIDMNVTVGELMTTRVMTVTKHETAGHAADLMRRHHVSALPVVGPDDEPLGIVTASDLLADRAAAAPVSSFMSSPVYTVPANEGPHVAARVMRNHHLHHVVVTEHHKVVGILSAYDLLGLVEDHRYTAKQAPTPPRKSPKRR
jgi:CBS domain-containing protein